MDDRGLIREFASDAEAKAAGFKTILTAEQAKELSQYPESERNALFAWEKHYEKLNRKMDTISKLHYRNGFLSGFNYKRDGDAK